MRWTIAMLVSVVLGVFACCGAVAEPLPDARPVPAMQVIPLPDGQALFQHRGRELSRYRFGADLRRPFCYPMQGPDERSLTRMGHPHDPFGHSHHNSVWISHHDVAGVDFWGDHSKDAGRIVHRLILQYEDGDEEAWVLGENAWEDAAGQVLLLERRRIAVAPLGTDDWLMTIDLEFRPPGDAAVTLGETPFGMIGVRMAKTIGVHDGGGRILNSQGQRNEAEVFRKPARWVDYSGPITSKATGGITLMDDPRNPGHPAAFHVRNDGWMGACLTLTGPMAVEADMPLRLRYGLWVHAGVPSAETIEPQWQAFSRRALPPMEKQSR